MATYNYEPAYPLNTEAGSTEKPLSAFQKIKAEFERIYRILNSSFATVDEMVAEARQSIANAISTFNQLAETLRSEMSTLSEELNSKINTKSKEASTVGTYTEVEANGTATQNGFLIVWHDNSGYQLCTLSIEGTVVGKWTGDGSYGGAMITGTFPIAKGQSWTWSGTYSAPTGKILFVPIGN